jgi:hypothetical protein
MLRISGFRKSVNLIFLVSIASLSPVTHASVLPSEEICLQRKSFYEEKLKSGVSFDSALKQIVRSKPDVIGFGEMHLTRSRLSYPAILRTIRRLDPRFDCVFVEFTSQHLAWIGQLLDDPSSKYSMPSKYRAVVSYLEVFQTAISLGMKIVPVDENQYLDPTLDRYVFRESGAGGIEDRNIEMAKRISHNLTHGQCRAGVQIVGRAHLYSRASSAAYESSGIQNLVAQLGHVYAPVSLLTTTANNDYLIFDRDWKWPDCPDSASITIPKQKTAFAIEPTALIGQPVFLPFGIDGQGNGLASDFSYIFVIPE